MTAAPLIEVAHTAHEAVGWAVSFAAWIGPGCIFAALVTAAWWACDRIQDAYRTHRDKRALRQRIAAERRLLAEVRHTLNHAAQHLNDDRRKEKP